MCQTARCVEAMLINEKQIKIQQQALELANQTGQWVAIYKDGEGRISCIRADLATGFPIQGYVSPDMRNPNL